MADVSINVYWQGALTVLAWILWPVALLLYYVGLILLFVAKLLYGPLSAFLQPFFYVGRFFLFLVTLPYFLLARFEALYNFLGVAAIIGLLIGLGMYYSAQQFEEVPDLGSYISSYIDEHVPWLSDKTTAKEYRHSKTGAFKPKHSSLPSSGYASLSDSFSTGHRGKRGMLATTILEEGDSDF